MKVKHLQISNLKAIQLLYAKTQIRLFFHVVSLEHQSKKTNKVMSRKQIFWGVVTLGLLWLGLFFYRRYQAIKRLQITPDLPNNWAYNSGFVTFNQRLIVNNADPVELSISRLNMDVTVNNVYVGKASLPSTQTVNANGISAVTIQITTTLTDLAVALGTTVFDLLNAKPFKLKYAGVIGAYGISTPQIEETISVNPSEIFKAIFK